MFVQSFFVSRMKVEKERKNGWSEEL